MPKKFNFIYEKLVTDENDIVGHIAYSIYKRDKVNYIKSKKVDENDISDEALKSFHEISSTESSIDSYKLKAELILQGLFENAFSEMSEDIEKQATENQTQILKEILKPYKPSFWGRVWSGLLTAFLFAFILAVIAFFLQYKDAKFEINVQQTPTVQGE